MHFAKDGEFDALRSKFCEKYALHSTFIDYMNENYFYAYYGWHVGSSGYCPSTNAQIEGFNKKFKDDATNHQRHPMGAFLTIYSNASKTVASALAGTNFPKRRLNNGEVLTVDTRSLVFVVQPPESLQELSLETYFQTRDRYITIRRHEYEIQSARTFSCGHALLFSVESGLRNNEQPYADLEIEPRRKPGRPGRVGTAFQQN